MMDCKLIGVPLQIGAGQLGCEMGPSALRVAGLKVALEELGHHVSDLGNVSPAPFRDLQHPNAAVHHLPETVAWTEALIETAYLESANAMPIFLGGDHALSAGTVAGLSRRAAERGDHFSCFGWTPTLIFTRLRRRRAAICTARRSPITRGDVALQVTSRRFRILSIRTMSA